LLVTLEQVLAHPRLGALGPVLRVGYPHPQGRVADKAAKHRKPACKPFRGPAPVGKQQRVLERQDGLGPARIALARAAPDQLAIDAPGLMPLGQYHVQPADCLHTGR